MNIKNCQKLKRNLCNKKIRTLKQALSHEIKFREVHGVI